MYVFMQILNNISVSFQKNILIKDTKISIEKKQYINDEATTGTCQNQFKKKIVHVRSKYCIFFFSLIFSIDKDHPSSITWLLMIYVIILQLNITNLAQIVFKYKQSKIFYLVLGKIM